MPYFDGLLFALASDTLGFWDWGTLIAYFAILLGIAWWVVQQSNKNSKDYFLAGRHTGWFVVGASLYASNIGSEHLVGLAGTGASDGMAMAHYELHAWCLLVLGWIMVPYYERSNIFTMPEFLERRYSPSARWFLSVVSLITYIFTKVSVTLFAGGIVFGALFPVDLFPWVSNFWLGAFGMVVITGLYTILGGLRAVLYTEVMQTGVLLLGAASVLFIGLWQVGGWVPLKEATQGADKMVAYQLTKYNSETGKVEPLKDKAGNTVFVKRFQGIGKYNPDLMDQGLTKSEAIEMNLEERLGMDIDQIGRLYGGGKGGFLTEMEKNEYNSNPPADRRVKTDYFNLWKPNSHPQFPWFGLLFGAPIVGLWYWCTEQHIVQRTLAARNQRQARRGTIFGAYLKLTPVFLFIVPGMIAYALAVQGKIGPEVLHDPNSAFPVLVKEVLPIGLKGIVVGALIAALMSSLAAVFNSSATLFTMDIYTKMRPNASEKQLVWMGRLATAVMVILGLAWIPVIRFMPGTLYGYLQSVQAYLAPPIFAVFFLGIYYKRVNAYGCMTGMIVGFILGMLRLAVEIMHGVSPFDDGTFLHWFATTSFTFVCIYLTVACSLIIILVSLMTPKPAPELLQGITYGNATPEQRRETRESWNKLDVILTAGLIATIIVIYIYFSRLMI